jgi:hypothetical protein
MEKKHLQDLDVDGRLTLKFMLETWDEKVWNGFTWLREQC